MAYFAILLSSALLLQAQSTDSKVFSVRCGGCHGADGKGGERGPRIGSDRGDLAKIIRDGAGTMPPQRLPAGEMAAIERFVRPLLVGPKPANAASIVPSKGSSRDWPTYHGNLSGNRYSPLAQVHRGNIGQLAPRWMYTVKSAGLHEATPIVADGVMYITAANEVNAIDPRDGREIWRFSRPRSKELIGDTSSGINRGVALKGNQVFTVTDNAHILALDRLTGRLLWETEMADAAKHYGSTSAPLVAGDVVIAGVSGGDEGARGFLDAYYTSTGERAWRFWTVPAPGEPLSETWRGKAIDHGCATTWFTGTYDPEAGLVYWPTGNPCPDYNGDERQGDNLYSNSVLALEPATGKLRWYFQYTPHDLHDWDATQTPVLVDRMFHGRPRKLLLHANRNGYFYALDRLTGEFLQATPFVKKLTWASAIDAKGRPVVNPAATPTPEGVTACPAVEGATNWFSVAHHPETGLFYLMALEKCSIYTKEPGPWEKGKSYYNGDTKRVPDEKPAKFLRALDPETGRIAWERPGMGSGGTWGGVLATAGGLVFYCDDSGAFAAADAKSGKLLWKFPTNTSWKASPMTYMIDGKQFIVVQAGSTVLVFGL